MSRTTLGGSPAASPSSRKANIASAGSLAIITFQCRSITTAGKGSWWASIRSSAARTCGKAGGVEPGLAIERRVARGQQHLVALAQRNVERARERQHHLAARVRAPALHEADVPGRDARLGRERELAHPALSPPVLEQRADRAGGHRPETVRPVRARGTSLGGNWNAAPFGATLPAMNEFTIHTPESAPAAAREALGALEQERRLHPEPGRDDRGIARGPPGLRRDAVGAAPQRAARPRSARSSG